MHDSALPAAPVRLTLYSARYCWYCRSVLQALKPLGLRVAQRDIMQDEAAQAELKSGTQRTRVPVLKIEDREGGVFWLPESQDIIRYLQKLARNKAGPAREGSAGKGSTQSGGFLRWFPWFGRRNAD